MREKKIPRSEVSKNGAMKKRHNFKKNSKIMELQLRSITKWTEKQIQYFSNDILRKIVKGTPAKPGKTSRI